MTRSTALSPRSLLERYLHEVEAVLASRENTAEGGESVEPILEVLAMTVAVEAVGDLGRVPPATREALRRAGARALLQTGPLLQVRPDGGDADADRAEGIRLIGPYARDGVRALAGKEPAPRRRDDAIVLDDDLTGLLRGRFDGMRLAEIAMRVRESREARHALSLLRRMEARDEGPRLRLAADGASVMRDPSTGRRIAELTVAGHAIELHRFDDATIAAYAASAVALRLGGEHVTSRVSRPGYAEASIGASATRLELDVGGVSATLEI